MRDERIVPGVRKKRRRSEHLTVGQKSFDWVILALLLVGPIIGFFLFGGTRIWSIGILMFLTSLGAGLYFLRVLMRGGVVIPPGGVISLLVVFYAIPLVWFAELPWNARFELLRIINLIAVYWAWSGLSIVRNRWRWCSGIVIVVIAGIAWYAIRQHTHSEAMVLNIPRPESYGMRASGTFICPNHFANVLVMMILLAATICFMPSAGWSLRIISFFAAASAFPVLLLTGSRSGWLSLIAGLGVCIALLSWQRSKKMFFSLLLAFPLLLTAIGFALWKWVDIFQERIGSSLEHADFRIHLWPDVLIMIRENLWTGIGPMGFRWLYPHYKTFNQQLWVRYAHNEYLHIAVEWGIVALFLVLLVGCVALFRWARIYSKSYSSDRVFFAGLAAVWAANLIHCLFDFNLRTYANIQLLLMISGLAAGRAASIGLVPIRPLKGFASRVVVGIAVICCLGGSWCSARYVAASYYIYKSQNLSLDDAAILAYLDKAENLGSSNWQVALGRAKVYKVKAFWDLDPEYKTKWGQQAEDYYLQAQALNPWDTEVFYGLSGVYRLMGRNDEAVASMKQAVDLAPTDAFFWKQLLICQRQVGDYQGLNETADELKELRIVPNKFIKTQLKMAVKAQNRDPD